MLTNLPVSCAFCMTMSRQLAQRVVVGPAEHELDRLAEAAAAPKAGGLTGNARAPGKFDTFGRTAAAHDVLLLHGALLPGHQAHDDDARIDRGGAREAGRHLAQHRRDDALLLQRHERRSTSFTRSRV